MAKPKRDAVFQAKLMVEAFGVERAYKMAEATAKLATGQTATWWWDVRKHIDYTPPPKERTVTERLYDNLCAWATEQGLAYTKNPYGYSITIGSDQPRFAIGVCPVLPSGDQDSTY